MNYGENTDYGSSGNNMSDEQANELAESLRKLSEDIRQRQENNNRNNGENGSEDDNGERVKITYGTIFSDFFALTVMGLFSGYFLKFYLEMDDDLQDRFISKMFFVCLILNGISILGHLLKIFQDFKGIGKEMTKKQYANYKIANSKFIKKILILHKHAVEIVLMIFVPSFIPYTNENCHDYSSGLCFYGRWNAFWGIIGMIIYGFVLIAVLALIVAICCSTRETDGPNTDQILTLSERLREISRRNQIANFVIDKTIFKHLISEEEECPICLETGEEGDKDFTKLKCGHTLHTKCLNTLLESNCDKICPECRQNIAGVNVKNFHEEETNRVVNEV